MHGTRQIPIKLHPTCVAKTVNYLKGTLAAPEDSVGKIQDRICEVSGLGASIRTPIVSVVTIVVIIKQATLGQREPGRAAPKRQSLNGPF
jgi:hypothetical protein